MTQKKATPQAGTGGDATEQENARTLAFLQNQVKSAGSSDPVLCFLRAPSFETFLRAFQPISPSRKHYDNRKTSKE
jgi:hypothetical protein